MIIETHCYYPLYIICFKILNKFQLLTNTVSWLSSIFLFSSSYTVGT